MIDFVQLEQQLTRIESVIRPHVSRLVRLMPSVMGEVDPDVADEFPDEAAHRLLVEFVRDKCLWDEFLEAMENAGLGTERRTYFGNLSYYSEPLIIFIFFLILVLNI